MLSGIDISHHNCKMKDPNVICNYDFVILKASEGKGYKDTYLHNYMDIITSSDKKPLIGFYHFARPEINCNPWDEANNFIEAVKFYLQYNPILALDVEARALTVPFLDDWCVDFCTIVYQETGIKPLIYCSASETMRFKKCAAFGSGLWVAKWSDRISKKDIKPWDFWAIWQNSASYILSGVRVDTDVFNGTRKQFLKYAGVDTDGKENDTASNDSASREALQEGKN